MNFLNFSFDWRGQRASALLLSFFLMSVLVLVGMAVSVLVIHDLQASRTTVSGVQALYAADGATELGLQTLKDNLPGYEPTFSDSIFLNNALASLSITARGTEVPCDAQDDANGWVALEQNQSMQIPLFAQTDADGNVENVDTFYVEFYVGDAEGNVVSPITTQDVLRWKVLGLDSSHETQAISEYIPMNGVHTYEEDPSVFGTDPEMVDASVPPGYKYGKYYSARENVTEPYYPIENFLASHSYNYLVLTNVVPRSSENTIYLKFVAQDDLGVCEYAKIAASGQGANGETQQNLDTLVKEGENLPVFDFVLYHTGQETSP